MHRPSAPPPRALSLAVAGLLALAVAQGIGRFAFTPLLPLMLAERSVDLTGASLLASANYLGYLLGALACTFQPWLWHRLGWTAAVEGPALLRAGLVATALLTLAMAPHWPAAWPALRLAAGVASAVVFMSTSSWCLEQLARRGQPAMGALIYTGPGVGIVATGLAASGLVVLQAPAAAGWLTFGLLAALLSATVWRVFDRRNEIGMRASAAVPTTAAGAGYRAPPLELGLLTAAYGLAGLGYIITATFLPVIARQALPGSAWLDLFWPLFGLGTILGAALASRLRAPGDQRLRLAACFALQAVGVAASLVRPTPAGFALGSLLLGLPFAAITFFALQEARRVRPQGAASFMGLLTAAYGLGQIAGPPIAAGLVARSASAAQGFDRSLLFATTVLVVGAGLYLLTARKYPLAPG